MDPDTAIGGPRAHFPSTQLSLLEATAAGLSSEALDRVIALYWKPVYHFIRLKFRTNNEDAKDLTQGFFAAALQRDFFARFDPVKASFRTYLRMAVERFAANEHAAAKSQKRGGDVEFETVEEQLVATESPEQAFEREWQRQLFSLALSDLRAHCDRLGKQLQFSVFQAYDLAESERPSYAELAMRHGVSEMSVTNYLAWARRLLRRFVTERLRGTTSGSQELHQEMRGVWR
jgi:RNA polymerase sigma-70 factor (ECF subfamily)